MQNIQSVIKLSKKITKLKQSNTNLQVIQNHQADLQKDL